MFTFFEKLVKPYPSEQPTTPPKSILQFLWLCTKGTRPYLFAMMVFTALTGVIEPMLFVILGKIVDWLTAIAPSQLWEKEGKTLLILSVALLISIVLVAFQTMFKHQTLAGNFPMRLRWNFHRLMLNQSMNFFQEEFAGRISAKVMQTALAVRDTCFIIMDILVFAIIYFVTMASAVGSFNRWLLLPLLSWLCLYLIAIYWFIPRLSKVSQSQADARSLMTGRITDAYTNITTVKLFSHAGREASYARSAMQSFMETVHAQMRLVSRIEIVNYTLNMLLVLGTSAIALWLWSQEAIGIGAITAATAMALRFNGMSQWIMWEVSSLFENIGTVQDGINTITQVPLITDRANADKLTVTKGQICFQNVTFGYDGQKNQTIFEQLNLTIKPGEKIGLVGRSGAGKSTLVNLLLRFHDIQNGQILIDDQDIASVTQSSLREQIGMVTQDTSLLHRSVRDNILYGKPEADDEEMIFASKRAEADEFIQSLVDSHGRHGYDAHVGERGVKLSGGQRQRLAIARVMLKDAPILLLDEATSALDSEVEAAIQRSLYRLMKGKTVIAIAHRLSTIAAMDRLIVLDKGKIVEQGDHSTLLAKGGLYSQLWQHQSGGFIGNESSESTDDVNT